MTDKGPEVLKAYKSLRQLTKQVSLLLTTTDSLMGEQGWECPHGSFCTSVGGNIQSSWIPRYTFLFYMRERKSGEEDEVQDTISMVSVILDDYQCQYQNLSEPLVIAGCFLYKPPRSLAKLKKQYHYNFAEYGPKICRSIDGRVYKWEPGAGDNVEFVRMAAFARPLVEIESADDLKRLITDPLFKLIKDDLEEGVNIIS